MAEGNLYPVRRKGKKKIIGHRWQMVYKGERTSQFFGPTISRQERARQISDLASEHRRTVDAKLSTGTQAELLTTYARKWLHDVEGEIEPRTLHRYRQDLDRHVIPALGDLRLDEITPKMVKDFLRKKRRTVINKETGKTYKKDTVRLMKAALSVVLTDAKEDGYITTNPAIFKEGRRRAGSSQSEQDEVRAMNADQRTLFLTEAHKTSLGVLFETLLRTGLRPGECFALRIEDVAFSFHTISVTKSVELISRRIKKTKTRKSRTVEISPTLAQTLRAHVASLHKRAMKKGWGEPTLLFPSSENSVLDHNNVARLFRQILKRAEVGGFRLYDLRHGYASIALANGSPLTYVAAQMGDSPETVLRYYARWIPSKGSKLAEISDGSAHNTHNAKIEGL